MLIASRDELGWEHHRPATHPDSVDSQATARRPGTAQNGHSSTVKCHTENTANRISRRTADRTSAPVIKAGTRYAHGLTAPMRRIRAGQPGPSRLIRSRGLRHRHHRVRGAPAPAARTWRIVGPDGEPTRISAGTRDRDWLERAAVGLRSGRGHPPHGHRAHLRRPVGGTGCRWTGWDHSFEGTRAAYSGAPHRVLGRGRPKCQKPTCLIPRSPAVVARAPPG